jgi:hypothetical protein
MSKSWLLNILEFGNRVDFSENMPPFLVFLEDSQAETAMMKIEQPLDI